MGAHSGRFGELICCVPGAVQRVTLHRRTGTVTNTIAGKVPALQCTADALHCVRDTKI